MKSVLPAAIVLAVLVLQFPALTAAVPGPVANAQSPASAGLAGQYKGSWKNAEASSGDLRITFRRDGEAAWAAEATFTYEGTEFPMRMKSIRVEGAKVEILFEWTVDGNVAHSKTEGVLVDDKVQGTYETGGAAGESRGTWSVTRV